MAHSKAALSIAEENNEKASGGNKSSLLEPKEEPLDEFIIMTVEKETVTQSAAIMKEDVKEEPLDSVDSFPVKNEISNRAAIYRSQVKKEPDEYIQDLVGLGLIPAWDAALDQSARYGKPPVFVEASIENVKVEIDSSVEQPLELADDFEPVLKKSRPNSKKANAILLCLDKSAENSSPNQPVESTAKVAAKSRESDEKEKQSLMKRLALMKNDTELECPECKFRSRFIRVWIRHLKKKHSITLKQAGLILRCKCGNGSQTGAHIVECNTSNNCVVRIDRKRTGELECPECEFRTRLPCAWVDHLKREHSTTPQLAGLALLCDCGEEAFTSNHAKKCSINNFTIIRKRDGPILRLGDVQTTPKCILCDAYPNTPWAYRLHLRAHHSSTLYKNNIFLKCSCGIDVRSESSHIHDDAESKRCDGLNFTLHKLEVPTTPQCILCEAHPTSVYAYAGHYHLRHQSSLMQNGIYLICSCGIEVRSYNKELHNEKECTGRNFTLHKMEPPSTLQCFLCEAYPSSVYAYAVHLNLKHKATLAANEIFLRCACGHEVRNSHRNLEHGKKCAGRSFTLHKLEVSNASLLEPKVESVDDSMPTENEISMQLFLGDAECKKEESIDNEEISNLTSASSPVKDEPIVDECVQDLARFGQQ